MQEPVKKMIWCTDFHFEVDQDKMTLKEFEDALEEFSEVLEPVVIRSGVAILYDDIESFEVGG